MGLGLGSRAGVVGRHLQAFGAEDQGPDLVVPSLARQFFTVEPEIERTHIPGFNFHFLAGLDGPLLPRAEGELGLIAVRHDRNPTLFPGFDQDKEGPGRRRRRDSCRRCGIG